MGATSRTDRSAGARLADPIRVGLVLAIAALLLLASASPAAGFDFLTKWGSMGSGDGQFANPRGVATDAAGNVYVADAGNDRIEKFTPGGAFLTKWGSSGSGDGQFSDPIGVAADAAGNVYVADPNNNRIEKLTRAASRLT